MTHSLIGADRATHVKIVCVALLGAVLIVTVGISARVAGHDDTSMRVQIEGPALKAGKPQVITTRSDVTIQ